MINANELRIGNLIYRTCYKIILCDGVVKDGYVTEMIKVDFNALRAISEGARHYTPIPLTPEILEKCGFSFGINLQSFVRGRHQFVEIKNMIDGYLSEDGVFYYGVRTKIKYIHQLQNLYFALTGEELIYKP